jgi:hypothetical protein
MLELRCDICHGLLDEPEALIFSPPMSKAWLIEKFHVCVDCWPTVVALLKTEAGEVGNV